MSDGNGPEERLRVVARGRVQGVGFREFTRRRATALDLDGWVRNLPDGSVELEAEGPRVALDQLLAALRDGPRFARVDGVESEARAVVRARSGFDVR